MNQTFYDRSSYVTLLVLVAIYLLSIMDLFNFSLCHVICLMQRQNNFCTPKGYQYHGISSISIDKFLTAFMVTITFEALINGVPKV